ncbi:unnamed protein product [Adineta ricciae]|uniref:G-protein coupled receptors family 1 profile domain-containing protein n=1 Tax=Adineta ricciae TaxID=249248 RepID=A0A814KVW1_ADIRI|nr:unnamed protein product [Adineta ricciae]CAF1177589.1 unnamed protein product [Adineta ricciae]
MSILNIGQLFTTVLSRILSELFDSDGTEKSLFYSIIDQYCATSSSPRLQNLCNIKLARRLILVFSIIWILYGLPYLILYNHIVLPMTHQVICTMTNIIYIQFRAYFTAPVLVGFLPILMTITFGSMAYRNIQQMRYYTVPLIRRELDKQLTSIVLAQGIINIFLLLPYTIMNIIVLTTNTLDNTFLKEQINFVNNITFIVFWIYSVCPFYIYIYVSQRFRRQFIHVFSQIHWKQNANQVMPQGQVE